MRQYFNTEGTCKPNTHYMMRIDERLGKIKQLYIDRGKYFVVNRGRQFGKTTTLIALEKYLEMLRGYYLKREDIPTFHSVVLAG